jgi:nucleoid DNA-binding protein
MNLTHIIDRVAKQVGAERDTARWLVYRVMNEVAVQLQSGNNVKVRDLGTFYWKVMPARTIYVLTTKERRRIAKRRVLRYAPSSRLKGCVMTDQKEDEGMDKYAVVLDDKVKQSSGGALSDLCPLCGVKLDKSGLCPTHGTEPMEKKRG